MKRLHIVNPYGSSAMNTMVAPLLSELPRLYEVSTSGEVDVTADVNFHMPWHSLIGLDAERKGDGKHVIAYTHVNPNMHPHLLDACERADLITCMSYEGRRELVEMGVDPKKLWVIYCAADFNYRKRLVGIVGYPQPNGRKRESIIMDLAWSYDLTPFQFLFVGDGWDNFVTQLQAVGVAASTVNADTPQKLADVYSRLDLLLVTGYTEGGPLPLLEAMAAGVPVLSPCFGYAADLLDETQLYDGLDELRAALSVWVEDSIHRHQLARAWTWRDYAAEYALVLGRLTGESVDLYPERGMSRYVQLLDVIDEIRPKDIVEIGTWNGHNAARMIQQAAKYKPMEDIFYQGFDLFESMTGAQFRQELSKWGWNKNVVQRKLEATGADVDLVEGDTKVTLFPALMLDDQTECSDFYFVDGGHSEETIVNDAKTVLEAMRYPPHAIAVFDDYYHTGKPDGVGCNKVIDSLDRNEFEVTHLPVRTLADDGREIGMVKVRRVNKRAMGGPVKAGELYLIGKDDANLFIPMREWTHATVTTSNGGMWITTNMPEVSERHVASTPSGSSQLERLTPAS